MKQANNGQTPRPEIQNAPPQTVVKTAPQFEPALPNLNLSSGADGLDQAIHARGGHGIFGEPKVCLRLNMLLLLLFLFDYLFILLLTDMKCNK